MFIYTVRIKVNAEIEDYWLEWMTEKHIPDVLRTGAFLKSLIIKVPDSTEYLIQYTARSREILNDYRMNFSPGLQKEHNELFEGKFSAMREEFEFIREFNTD
jgi:hypothetical protein